ncbi:M23 family metallopeptidase [bacterium]|nr:M23 family metallopeptidase [bacterium]
MPSETRRMRKNTTSNWHSNIRISLGGDNLFRRVYCGRIDFLVESLQKRDYHLRMKSAIETGLVILLLCAAVPGYEWVLPGHYMMTSSFAEFRVGHFHGGIDLRAGVGTPVAAPTDGWVMRAKVSPWGYGKALYFAGDDSLIFVFGHLSRFAEPVQSAVVSEQYRRKSPIVDIFFKDKKFRFKKGEIIGYTGESGVGKPHLHFETRRNLKTFVSPILYGFAPPDSFPPTITSVAVVPLGGNTVIEENLLPLLVKSGGRFWGGREPIRFYGKIGFAVSFYDLTGPENKNWMGVRKIELLIDGQKAFSCDYDSFKIGETKDVGFLYDGGLEYFYGRRFHKLFMEDSLRITPLLDDSIGSGIIDFDITSPVVHRVRIYLEDFAGNATECTLSVFPAPLVEVSLQFMYDDSGRVFLKLDGDSENVAIDFCPLGDTVFTQVAVNRGAIYLENRKGFFRLRGIGDKQVYPFILGTEMETPYRSEQCSLFVLGNYLYYLVKLDNYPQCVPEFAISHFDIEYQMLTPKKWLLRHEVSALGGSMYPFVEVFLGDPDFPYAKLGEFNPVYCLMGNWTSSTSESRMWKTTVDVPGGALYHSVAIYNWSEPVNGDNIASEMVHYLPHWLYFRENARISFEPTAQNNLPEDTLKKLCIVRWWKGNWYYVPTKVKGRRLYAEIRALGDFALMWDNQPPEVKLLSASADTIVFAFDDNLSGFGADNLPQIYIDSLWTLGEYDFDKKTILALPKDKLLPGKHTVKVVAIDRCGNKFDKEWTITVR